MMITRYKEFITENNTVGITPEELELLKKYKIKKYSFNMETGRIDVKGNVNLSEKKLKSLPKIRFGKIEGDFICSDNFITSLLYSPIEVTDDFYCFNNRLSSLEHCPESARTFACSFNKLTSLEHCPKIIPRFFLCEGNSLTSLEHGPSWVGSTFKCPNNKLESLDFLPDYIGGDLFCNSNPDLTIADFPLTEIKGRIISFNPLFDIIIKLMDKKPELYSELKKDKAKFHQQVMRDDPSLIKYYTDTPIPIPSKKTFI